MKFVLAVHRYVLTIVMAVCGLATAQEAPVNMSPKEPGANRDLHGLSDSLEQLQSDNNGTRQAAAKEVSEYRTEAVAKLIRIVAGDGKEEAKVAAMHLLGEYRAKEAVSVLVENFRTAWRIHVGSMVTDAELMPAGDALVQIGEPSIPALISKLATTDDKDTRGTYLYVLKRIERDKQILQLRIQKAIDQDNVESRKANLQKAIDGLKTVRAVPTDDGKRDASPTRRESTGDE